MPGRGQCLADGLPDRGALVEREVAGAPRRSQIEPAAAAGGEPPGTVRGAVPAQQRLRRGELTAGKARQRPGWWTKSDGVSAHAAHRCASARASARAGSRG